MYSVASSDKASSSTSTVHRNSDNAAGVDTLSRKADNKNSDSLSFLINRSSFPVQAKVKIGKPDDKYEKEADAVAEKVMTSPAAINAPQIQMQEKEEQAQAKFHIQKQEREEEEQAQAKFDIQKQEEEQAQTKLNVQKQEKEEEKGGKGEEGKKEEDLGGGTGESVQTKSKPSGKKDKKKEGIKYIVNVNEPEEKPEEEVQRKASPVQLKSSEAVSSGHQRSSFESSLESSKGSGAPLPAQTRTHMESQMGADFSGVKIHTDRNAVQMSNQINAQAFTHGNDIYFNEGKYSPGSSEGKSLIAHELTHTVQQGASVQKKSSQTNVRKKSSHAANNQQVVQRSWLGDAWDAVTDVASSAVEFVSESLDAGLNWIKEKFTNFVKGIPGYKLLGVVLGQDPITGDPIARNGRNFIEAGLDIIPFGSQFKRKLEETGALEEAAAWLDNQIAGLDISLGAIKADISAFWDSLSLSDIGDPTGVLERAANIIRRPIGQIITFAGNVATEFLRIVKNYVLSELALFVKNNTRGYPLLTVILGKDPITDEPVERNGMNLIKGFMMLSADGEEQLRQMEETGSLQKAADWIDTTVAELDLSWETIKSIFTDAWNLITIENLMTPIETFQKLVNLFAAPVGRIITFVIKVGLKILELIKDALLRRLSDFAHETRGFHLLTVILGKNPFTGEVVERNPENVIRGFMSLMDGGEEQFQQMKQTGAIKRTTDRIDGAVERLGFTWEYITGLFTEAWNSFSLQDLAAPFEAFARIVKLFGKPILRLIAFVWEILKIVIEVLLIIMKFPFDIVNNIITKSMQAIEDIKRDPIGFLKNILRAIKQGFVQFFDNILKHLLFGVTGWLFGELKDAGINPPKDFTFKSVLGFVLEVLGITMDKIWKKLADKIGQDKVDKIRGMIDKLEGIWTFVKDVATRGPIAIWEYIVEKLSNLWDTVLEAVRNWVITKIIQQVTVKLLSLLDPTGIMAVVNSVIAIYKAIESFVRYIKEMLEILNSFVNGVAEIAKGNIKAAADFIENAMRRSMPVIIGFLANQVGLGGVGKKIGEIIEKVREKVDGAIGWLVDKAVNAGTAFLNMLKSGAAAVKEGVASIIQWWKDKQKFKTEDGASHTFFFQGESEANAVPTVASKTMPLSQYTNEMRAFLKEQLEKEQITSSKYTSYINTVGEIETVQSQINDEKTRSYESKSGGKTVERTADFTGEKAKKIRKLSLNLTKLLARLPDKDSETDKEGKAIRPPTTIKYGGSWLTKAADAGLAEDSKDATYMHADVLSVNPGSHTGSSPSYYSSLYKEVNKRSGKYKQGHLLWHHLHGKGTSFENLTPISDDANKAMAGGAESELEKRVLKENQVVKYYVDVKYATTKVKAADVKGIPAEAYLANDIDIKMWSLKFNKEAFAGKPQEEIDKAKLQPANWSQDAQISVPGVTLNNFKDIAFGSTVPTLSGSTSRQLIDLGLQQIFAEAITVERSSGAFNSSDFEIRMKKAYYRQQRTDSWKQTQIDLAKKLIEDNKLGY